LSSDPPNVLVWSANHLRLAIDAAGVALWSWNVDTDRLTMDERGCRLWDIPASVDVTFEDLSAHIHPADRDRVRAAGAATRALVGAYEIDFRIMVSDVVRWISARGQGNDDGIVRRLMFGIFLDVTGRKQAEEGHELLAGEMSHRVKNLLAIASSITRLTSRSAATTADMARELTERLSALGLPSPWAGGQSSAARRPVLRSARPVRQLGGVQRARARRRAQNGHGRECRDSLAPVIHELATNSVKYGALSIPTGLLDVACTSNETEVAVVWTERGGPAVSAPPERTGFGSDLIARTMSSRFSGSLEYNWSPDGLIATLTMQKARMSS
jgi:two-component sensor histidine kinase